MCMSCGCKDYENSHNDERNITIATLRRASSSSDIPVSQIMENVRAACEDMARTGIPDHQSLGGAVTQRLHPD